MTNTPLLVYGFHKVNDLIHSNLTNENQTWEFKHPNFRRGAVGDLQNVKRKNAKSQQVQQAQQAQQAQHAQMQEQLQIQHQQQQQHHQQLQQHQQQLQLQQQEHQRQQEQQQRQQQQDYDNRGINVNNYDRNNENYDGKDDNDIQNIDQDETEANNDTDNNNTDDIPPGSTNNDTFGNIKTENSEEDGSVIRHILRIEDHLQGITKSCESLYNEVGRLRQIVSKQQDVSLTNVVHFEVILIYGLGHAGFSRCRIFKYKHQLVGSTCTLLIK